MLKEEAVLKSLHDRGLFIVGDSAHSVLAYLITPCDAEDTRDDVDGERDPFNFHLSSCRIYIECAFGELIMQWGIFWRTLHKDHTSRHVATQSHN